MDLFDLASSGAGVSSSYKAQENTTSLVAEFKTPAQPIIRVETLIPGKVEGDPLAAFLKAARTVDSGSQFKVSVSGKAEENPDKAGELIRKVVNAVSDLTI